VKDYGDEQVWVVPRELLFAGDAPQGFVAGGVDGLVERALTHGRFVPRGPAETDASLQQVIPYVVLVQDGQVWLMQRLAKQGEQRLHNRFSIGVGGHINPEDAVHGADPITGGLRRELHEELAIEGEPAGLRPLGILKDDSNAVGQVHVGLVYEALADGCGVRVREVEHMTGRFVSLAEAHGHRDRMETWSQLLVDALGNGLRSAVRRPAGHGG
jgi:predicted NUDIX family phosphoesterase